MLNQILCVNPCIDVLAGCVSGPLYMADLDTILHHYWALEDNASDYDKDRDCLLQVMQLFAVHV
jgi:hypothetical protein